MGIAKTKVERTALERRSLTDWTAIFIATGGGAGFMPKAPGTAGAIVGLLAYLALEAAQLGRYYPHAILFLFIVGVWAAYRAEIFWEHDSQRIVIDEIIGQMITFAFAAGRFRLSAFDIVAGFVLFRLFDILKPFPLRRLELLPGGFGVVMDDVGAGLYALALLSLKQHFFGV
jgi:phosphatidylglycerophosphatase A